MYLKLMEHADSMIMCSLAWFLLHVWSCPVKYLKERFDTDCGNAVLQEASLILDQQQQSVTPGMCTVQKQT